jgi:hypothetical protein
MAVALRTGAAGVTVPSPGTQQAVTLPSGAKQNDLIQIYCASCSASNSFSSPGFSSSAPVSGTGGGGSAQLLWKFNTGNDPAGTQYLVTAAFADTWGAIIVANGRCDQVIVFDGGASSGEIATAVSTVTPNSPVTTWPATRLNWFGFTLLPAGVATLWQPPGFTAEIAQVNSTLAAPAQNIALIFADYTTRGTPAAPFTAGFLNAAAGNTVYTLDISTATGLGDNLLLAVSVTSAATVISVEDTENQNWQLVEASADGNLYIYQCESTSVLTTAAGEIEITISADTGAVNAFLIDDPGSLELDVTVLNTGTGTTASQATGTLGFTGEHIFAFTYVSVGFSAFSWSAPMTSFGNSPQSGNSAGCLGVAYDEVTGTGSVTPTSTWTTAEAWDMIVVTARPWSIQPGAVSSASITGAAMVGIPVTEPLPQARQSPRGFGRYPLYSRRRRQAIIPIQQTGTQFPLVIRQRPRPAQWPPHWIRGRAFDTPIPAQANQGQPWPAVTRQPGRMVRVAFFYRQLRRIRAIAPGGLGQGAQAPRWQPLPAGRPGWRRLAPKLRRSVVTTPEPVQLAAGSPWLTTTRTRRRKLENVRVYRRHAFGPPLPQAHQASGNPAIMIPVRKSRQRPWAWFRKRPRVFSHLIPKATQQGSAALQAHTSVTFTGARGVAAAVFLRAPSTATVTASPVARAGMVSLASASKLAAAARHTAVASAALASPSALSATAGVSRRGSAVLQAASSLSATGTDSSAATLSARSTLSATSLNATSASASWSALSVLAAVATAAPMQTEITIIPLTVPGVNEPATGTARNNEPVTGSVVTGEVDGGIYDDGS